MARSSKKELFNFAAKFKQILTFSPVSPRKGEGFTTMDVKERGGGKCSCRSQECQDLQWKLCQDQTFKRTSDEFQNLTHTNKFMGNDRETIFGMVCTPSSTRGLILWKGPSSDPLTIEYHQRHVHLVCENKTFVVSYRPHAFKAPWLLVSESQRILSS